MARALVRRITRKQALSYDYIPNGRGVTALVEVNGRGAYARRYQQAERILRRAKVRSRARGGAMLRRKKHRRNPGRASVGASRKYSRGWGRIFGPKRKPARKGKATTRFMRVKRSRSHTRRVAVPRYPISTPRMIGAPWKKKRRLSAKQKAVLAAGRRKAAAMRAQVALTGRGLSAARRKRKTPKRKSKRGLVRRFAGGRYTTVVARLGRKRRRTYAYTTKKGNVRHVPLYGQLGFTSSLAMRRAIAKGGRRAAAIEKRIAHIQESRTRAAERASKRVLAGRDPFTRNVRRRKRRTVKFEEWQMVPNRKRRTRRRRRLTSNPKRRRRTTRRRRAAVRRKPTTRRRRRRTTTRRATTRRRRRRLTANPRRRTRRKRRRMSPRTRLKIARTLRRKSAKHLRRYAKSIRKRPYSRRQISRHLYGVAESISRTKFNNNRRRRRGYRRNIAGAFVDNLKSILKFGTIGFAGYGLHRAVTRLVDENLMTKIGFLNGPSVAPYRPLITSVITGLLGAFGIAKFAPPKYAQTAGAGLAISVMQQLILTVLGKLGDTGSKITPYLSAYPDESGYPYNGYGSYFTFNPHQVYPAHLRAGIGEYYDTAPTGLRQQAAGFGAMPLLQAAAGIGEYEVVPGFGSDGLMDEGIAPNLYSAEQALNVAEAAAGMGDLSLVSTVDPMMQAVPVPDEPGGSRSGVLAGRDGVFG